MEGQGAEIFPIPTLPRRFLPPPHQPPPGPASHTGNERLAGSEQGWQQRRGSHFDLFMCFCLESGERNRWGLGPAAPSASAPQRARGAGAQDPPCRQAGRREGRERCWLSRGMSRFLENAGPLSWRWASSLLGSAERWLPDGEGGPRPARGEGGGGGRARRRRRRHLRAVPRLRPCRPRAGRREHGVKAGGPPTPEKSRRSPCLH